MPSPPSGAATGELLSRTIVWDNHTCMPVRVGDTAFMDQLSRHQRGGATVVVHNVSFDAMEWHHALKMLATFRCWIQQHSQDYVLVERVDDIVQAKAQGKLGIAFDLEGGCAVDDQPALVEVYYKLGVRWMLLAYNCSNRLGGGCQEEDAGLTAFGRRVIDEMERVGMVLCCTHTGYRTARDALDYAHNPVIFSHSNPRALHDHERNIPDDLIRACAATGGVIGINGIGVFLGDNDNSTATILRHIRYVAELVGPAHVGLGLDYVYDMAEIRGYIAAHPEFYPPEKGYGCGDIALVEPERIPAIADALLNSGWCEHDVQGVLGHNFLRVARQVWK